MADALAEFRTIYTSEVVERVRQQGITVTHDYEDREGAVPLPATLSMMLGNQIGARESKTQTRLYSAFPFPWRRAGGGLLRPGNRWVHLLNVRPPAITCCTSGPLLYYWSCFSSQWLSSFGTLIGSNRTW